MSGESWLRPRWCLARRAWEGLLVVDVRAVVGTDNWGKVLTTNAVLGMASWSPALRRGLYRQHIDDSGDDTEYETILD